MPQRTAPKQLFPCWACVVLLEPYILQKHELNKKQGLGCDDFLKACNGACHHVAVEELLGGGRGPRPSWSQAHVKKAQGAEAAPVGLSQVWQDCWPAHWFRPKKAGGRRKPLAQCLPVQRPGRVDFNSSYKAIGNCPLHSP